MGNFGVVNDSKLIVGVVNLRYAISDIHGDFNSFEKMIKLINLKPSDTLYILGDIIDRGREPVKLLKYIMEQENFVCLIGNHEKMAIDSLVRNHLSYNWCDNGGSVTYEQLHTEGAEFKRNIIKWMRMLPLFYIIDDLKIILIHAGFYADKEDTNWQDIVKKNDIDDFVWARPKGSFTYNGGNTGYKYIVGHTPTLSIDKGLDVGEILEIGNTTYIDCGNAYKKRGGRLGCIRLEDGKKFYI